MTAERVAAIYDIHGNLPALEAVLADVRRAGVDYVVVGGDVVPGPMPVEALTRLLELDLPVQFIRGNGDREVLARMRGIDTGTVPERFRPVMDWVAAQLHPEHAALIAGWPATMRLEVAALGAVMFCHATPRNDTEIFTRTTREEQLAPVFAGVDAPLVVCGHTHMQFDRMVGATRVVNAGSVGMPFAEPAAYWLQLGPDVQLRRTDYDLAAAASRVRATRYPQAEEFAARDVLHPPTEREMLERFSAAEIK
jgi:putative phosphoesterase